MQALLSMMNSVPGFLGPGLIAYHILRTPEEIDVSTDGREMNALALIAPGFSLLCLVGYLYIFRNAATEEEDEFISTDLEIDERLALLGGVGDIGVFHPWTEGHRRQSEIVMGVPLISFQRDIPRQPQRHTVV